MSHAWIRAHAGLVPMPISVSSGHFAPLLISVVKSNKYALLGVLGFDAKGGHITYENTYHSCFSSYEHVWAR